MALPTPDSVRKARKEAVEAALREGFPPPGIATKGYHGALAEAGKRLATARQTMDGWLRIETREKAAGNPHFMPDWSLHVVPGQPQGEASPPPLHRSDEIRLRDEIASLKRERDQLARELIGRNDLRAALSDVLAEPIQPAPVSLPDRPHTDHAETVILFVSDLQWGETVDLAAMDGLNSFDTEIASARLARAFHATTSLCTDHWAGPSPARVILILGGDLISGGIHEELGKTDRGGPFWQTKDCTSHLIANIDALRDALPCPVDIVVLPGNHARNTKKSESKGYALESYDTLAGEFLAMHYQGDAQVTVTIPASGDAVFPVYNWTVLATHGDRIGSRGGAGFVGTAATVARGFKKLRMDYSARGINLDLILCGHFHTALQLEEGFCNGSLVGPNEYARDLRFMPKPAVQLFLTIHPKRGVTQQRWLQVGDPTEGSVYEAPAFPSVARPRYRVKAVGSAA